MRRRIAATATVALIATGAILPSVAAHADDPSTSTVSQLASLLAVASPELVGYDRDLFGDWTYTTGDDCDTRANLLKAQSTASVTFSSGCTVATGQWLSWYDNQTWTSASDVQIDHLVPLAEAWASGAWAWTPAQRSAFANDTIGYQLQIVTSSVNESKGDQDPTVWMPPAASAQCQYITDWVLTKYRWSLTVDSSEQEAIAGYLADDNCGDQTVTVPTVQVAPAAPPTAADAAPVYRFYSPTFQTHFYTMNATERDSIIADYPKNVWTYEGQAFTAFTTEQPGTVALYRFWSPLYSGHFYTTNAAEKDGVIAKYPSSVWSFEGTAFYVYPITSTVTDSLPVARFYSPNTGHHFYTANASEAAVVKTYPAAVWTYEDDDFRVPPSPTVSFAVDCSSSPNTLVTVNNPTVSNVNIGVELDVNGDGIGDSGDGFSVAAHTLNYQYRPFSLPEDSSGTIILTVNSVLVGTQPYHVDCVPNGPSGPPVGPTQPSNPGDTKNCSDFANWSAAQAWFNTYYPYYGDVAKLDADHDGIACESLPGHP